MAKHIVGIFFFLFIRQADAAMQASKALRSIAAHSPYHVY